MAAVSLLTGFFRDPVVEVSVLQRRCLKNRLNSCRCALCIDACPTGALRYHNSHIEIDSSICSGCMRCSAVCPNEVFISSYDFSSALEAAVRDENECIVFSCPNQKQYAESETVVPCHAVFSVEALLFLGTSGKKEIHFNTADCASCVNNSALLQFSRELAGLLKQFGASLPAAFLLQAAPIHDEKISARRSFLAALKKRALSVACPTRQSTGLDNCAVSRRITPNISLRQKGIAAAIYSTSLTENILPFLTVSDTCRPCPRCAGICPTGALRLKKENGSKRLEFNRHHCSSCGLCLDFCKHSALRLFTPYSF
ncbi:MAG: 4Fe-4S dicluster domain-containing protein [Desulfopila sp.]|nr:4Fe-4S dicluster domain-containing protein [Desulfopila sp.]